MKVRVTILKRGTLALVGAYDSYQWDIAEDYLSSEASHFEVAEEITIAKGDFLFVKFDSGKYTKVIDDRTIRPFYTGVVTSSETSDGLTRINTQNFYNVLDFDFVATTKSGSDVAGHMLSLLNLYFFGDSTKLASFITVKKDGSPISYAYNPSNPPTSTNLVDYFVNIFKKYGVSWQVDGITRLDNGQYVISTVLKRTTKVFTIKDNVADFQNWDVYVTEGLGTKENMLRIVDKATKNSESPVILSTWYLTENGTITQNATSVVQPTRSKIYLYDTAATDKPSYQAVAQSELEGVTYSHEITFELSLDSQVLQLSELDIGMLTSIIYDNRQYNSILTGYSLASADGYAVLRFGFIRSKFKQILKGVQR